MALWTDLIDPADLTGYARESMADYELRQGSLAQWLPNREIADIVARFRTGRNGLVEEALWRAYDAETEIGKRQPGARKIIEIPALGLKIPVSEYEQLRTRNADDESMRNEILRTADAVVRGVADAVERLRGVVLTTGRATVDQENFQIDDAFGRSASHDVTAANLWTDTSVSRLADLQAWVDVYTDSNGVEPGAIVGSNRALRALSQGDEFATQLANGGSRPATEGDVQAIISGAGLPPLVKYNRRTASGRVLPDDRLFLLPAPVGPDQYQATELGATFWGQTLTSQEPEYGLAPSEQPGVVVGTYKNSKPPVIAEVISDAIALPVLANADLSFVAKVL